MTKIIVLGQQIGIILQHDLKLKKMKNIKGLKNGNYLLTIEFSYNDAPEHEGEPVQYIRKKITIGIYGTREEANLKGNKSMELFEKHFKLNPYHNRKERFSNNGGCFGSPKDLITNLAYLQTPFNFFAKITKLNYEDLEQTIMNATEAAKRHNEYKISEAY